MAKQPSDRPTAAVEVRKKKPRSVPASTSTSSKPSSSKLMLDGIFSSIPVDVRKSKKKTSDSSEKPKRRRETEDGATSQLDDILSLLSADTAPPGRAKKQHKSDSKSSERTKEKSGGELDDILSVLDARSSKRKEPTTAAADAEGVRAKKKKLKSDAGLALSQPRAAVTSEEEVSAIAPPSQLPHEPSSPSPSAPAPAPFASAPAPAIADPNLLLKRLKIAHRNLSSSLSSLSTDTVLVDRIWYKNKSQFKSAFWWASFDAVRRTLHRLLSPPCANALRSLALVYAGLGAGTEGLQVAESAESGGLMKFVTKPMISTMQDFISSPEGREVLQEAREQMLVLEAVLEELVRRCEEAGKVLVRHLSTPPAPTFAPLVTALLALVAGVCEGAREGLEGKAAVEGKDGQQGKKADAGEGSRKGPVGVARELLEELSSL